MVEWFRRMHTLPYPVIKLPASEFEPGDVAHVDHQQGIVFVPDDVPPEVMPYLLVSCGMASQRAGARLADSRRSLPPGWAWLNGYLVGVAPFRHQTAERRRPALATVA